MNYEDSEEFAEQYQARIHRLASRREESERRKELADRAGELLDLLAVRDEAGLAEFFAKEAVLAAEDPEQEYMTHVAGQTLLACSGVSELAGRVCRVFGERIPQIVADFWAQKSVQYRGASWLRLALLFPAGGRVDQIVDLAVTVSRRRAAVACSELPLVLAMRVMRFRDLFVSGGRLYVFSDSKWASADPKPVVSDTVQRLVFAFDADIRRSRAVGSSEGLKAIPVYSKAIKKLSALTFPSRALSVFLSLLTVVHEVRFDRPEVFFLADGSARAVAGGELFDFQSLPGDFATRRLKFWSWSVGDTENFRSFFQQVLPSRVTRDYLLRVFCYALLGRNTRQLYFWLGSGGNGKSVLERIVSDAFGDYLVTMEAEDLWKTRASNAAAPSLLKMKGARFVFAREPGKGKAKSGLYKQLTGGRGSYVEARDFHSSKYEKIEFDAAIIIEANWGYTPIFERCGSNEQRFVVIDFPCTFVSRIEPWMNRELTFLQNPQLHNEAFVSSLGRGLLGEIMRVMPSCASEDPEALSIWGLNDPSRFSIVDATNTFWTSMEQRSADVDISGLFAYSSR